MSLTHGQNQGFNDYIETSTQQLESSASIESEHTRLIKLNLLLPTIRLGTKIEAKFTLKYEDTTLQLYYGFYLHREAMGEESG